MFDGSFTQIVLTVRLATSSLAAGLLLMLNQYHVFAARCIMSHYTMIYKNGVRMRDFLGLFVFIVV